AQVSDEGGPFEIACFVDDDHKKRGSLVRGIRVAGALSDLGALVAKYQADLIVIAQRSPRGDLVRRVLEQCEALNVAVRAVRSFDLGEKPGLPLRSIDIDELLQRAPVRFQWDEAEEYIAGKSILITGAAGSIGSELCRQVLFHRPSTLVLYDSSESGLYDLNA